MHTPGKTYGKERNLPQAPERQSMSQSVSLLELKKFDKTKIQRWSLFFGGDGIGKKKNDDSRIRYSDAQWY